MRPSTGTAPPQMGQGLNSGLGPSVSRAASSAGSRGRTASRDILCYAMKTLRCCSIVMHIHDELVIEADPRMSLEAVCEQMGRTPPWAKGLLLRADGYETEFYKKD